MRRGRALSTPPPSVHLGRRRAQTGLVTHLTVVQGDITVQTKQTLDNLMRILEAAGATTKNVVNMRVCLRDVADFPKFNESFKEYMAGEKITRTCIGGTPHRTGINVEIDCVAMFD